MSINRVNLTGNLGAEPELRKTQSGMSVLNMRLAVNDRRKNQHTGEYEDYCNWVGVIVFGNRADALANMLHKGSKVGIDGKLRYSEWQTNEGQKRSKLEVIADDVELLTPKGQNGGGGYQGGYQQQGGGYNPNGYSAPQNAPQQPQGYQQAPQQAPVSSVYEDDIPF